MIGFKKVPTKLVLSAFFISIFFILLLYTDTVLNKPLPEEEIKITKNLVNTNRKFIPCNTCDVDGTLMGQKNSQFFR